MSVKEIEEAIERLPAHELTELTNWLAAYHEANQNQQVEAVFDLGQPNNPIRIMSPRLVRPGDAEFLRQEVSEELTAAGL